MKNMQAVVFDVDGTILDTREFIRQAYEHTLQSFGIPMPEKAFFDSHIGPPLEECYKIFAPGIPYAELADRHREFQRGHFDLIALYSGVVEMCSALKKNNLKIAVCSTRSGRLVETLQHAGVKDLINAVVDGSHVTKHKPDPEGILLALQQLNVAAADAVFVGDTSVDIQAGKNAEVPVVIGITHGFGTHAELEAAGADHIVDNLSEIIPILTAIR